MKKVFTVDIEEIEDNILRARRSHEVFAKDVKEATEKIEQILPEKWHIKKVELFCIVEEDKDLEAWIDE